MYDGRSDTRSGRFFKNRRSGQERNPDAAQDTDGTCPPANPSKRNDSAIFLDLIAGQIPSAAAASDSAFALADVNRLGQFGVNLPTPVGKPELLASRQFVEVDILRSRHGTVASFPREGRG